MATKKVTPITDAKPRAATGSAVAVKKTGGAVVDIAAMKAKLQAQAASIGNKTGAITGNSIRVTQDKQFILPNGSKVPGPLELVIIDFTSRNSFYEGAFDPKNISPPACFAIGDDPKSLVPSKNAPLPQASDCASCPMNAFGSAGDGKACKNTRVLAVMLADQPADGPIWTLATSPTANKGFDGYVAGLGSRMQLAPVEVITTVDFDDSVTYAKLVFSTEPELNGNLAEHFARQGEAAQMLAAEPDVSGFVAKAAAPAGRKAVGRR